MKVLMLSRQLRSAVWLSAALLAAACGGENVVGPNAPTQPLPSGVAPAVAPFRVGLEYGGNKAVGQRIQIAVATDGSVPEGLIGLQGFLRYDAAKLTYEGVDAAHGGYVAVGESEGAVRFSAVALPKLQRDAAVFVFTVKSADFASSLKFELEEAAFKNDVVFSAAPSFAREVALAQVATASKPTLAEWNGILERQGYKNVRDVAARPGDGTIYGDVNLSGSVTVGDVTYLGNVAVAGFPLLDPAANRDGALAGNVRPTNNADGITVGQGDPCPPGVVCSGTAPNFRQTAQGTISTADVSQVLLATVDPTVAVVGAAIPKTVTTTGTIALAEGVYDIPSIATVAGNGFVAGDSICTATVGGAAMPTQWVRGNLYRLDGIVQVGGGCNLRIQGGVTVQGNTAINPNALYIRRDGRIFAEGSSTAPIVFTCTGAKVKGCWGGLAIAGNAPVNLQDPTIPTAPVVPGRNPTAGGVTRALEGPVPLSYGGDNPDDNSGVVRYVRIEYAGFIVGANNELNGLSVGGVGRGTTIEYVQVHGGLDDAYEMFGGTVSAKYMYFTANQDDDFDWSFGWQGNAQFIISQKDSLDGDTSLEGDNSEGTGVTFNETPRTNGSIWNYTTVGKLTPSGTGTRGVNTPVRMANIRRGNWSKIGNLIGMGYPGILDLDDAATCTGNATDPNISFSVVGNYTTLNDPDTGDPTNCAGGTEETMLTNTALSNESRGPTNAIAAELIRPYDVQTPDFRPVPGSGIATKAAAPAPAGQSFITSVSYIGAVEPATPTSFNNIPWYAGWTRGWTTPLVP